MSNIGKPCERQLYYEINNPEEKEELSPSVRMKFLFGHVIEEIILYLAEVAGHTVEGRQDEASIAGIKGHRDAVISGTLVDVKSASTYSFKKFESGLEPEGDSFGYIPQLQSYLHDGQTDDKITDKGRAAFFVVDKTLGNLCLDIHEKEDWNPEEVFEAKKEMVSKSEPPARAFEDVPDGKSGNRKLGVNCSYCDFRKLCWPDLKEYIYSSGPRYLTHVAREPRVESIGETKVEWNTSGPPSEIDQ